MLPFVGFAMVAVYAAYVAHDTRRLREAAALAPAPPDHLAELEQIHTELSRQASQARRTLESARDAMQRGLRG